MATMFLSKYALSGGIEEVEIAPSPSGVANGDRVKPSGMHSYFKVGDEIHFTRADAVKRANADWIRKIESLEKQISKLKELLFS